MKSGWSGGAKRSGNVINVQTDRGEEWRKAYGSFLAGLHGRSADPDHEFVEIVCRQMVGVMLLVFVRRHLLPDVVPLW
ncbi:hypothetical protein T484DRAFT_1790703 [Baffinella frigidus]|nr:hypothetical protein T484DRAFT_1790703 [Cryptophyta sp. CCMP2293]